MKLLFLFGLLFFCFNQAAVVRDNLSGSRKRKQNIFKSIFKGIFFSWLFITANKSPTGTASNDPTACAFPFRDLALYSYEYDAGALGSPNVTSSAEVVELALQNLSISYDRVMIQNFWCNDFSIKKFLVGSSVPITCMPLQRSGSWIGKLPKFSMVYQLRHLSSSSPLRYFNCLFQWRRIHNGYGNHLNPR